MVYRNSVLSICLALGLNTASWAQHSGAGPGLDAVFDQGVDAYRNGDLDRALALFRQVSEENTNRQTSAAYLMLGKTLFRLGNYPGALEAVKTLKYRFPKSRYRNDARLLIGTVITRRSAILKPPASMGHW